MNKIEQGANILIIWNVADEDDVEKAKQTTGIIKKCNVEKTVENIMETFHSNEKSPFN